MGLNFVVPPVAFGRPTKSASHHYCYRLPLLRAAQARSLATSPCWSPCGSVPVQAVEAWLVWGMELHVAQGIFGFPKNQHATSPGPLQLTAPPSRLRPPCPPQPPLDPAKPAIARHKGTTTRQSPKDYFVIYRRPFTTPPPMRFLLISTTPREGREAWFKQTHARRDLLDTPTANFSNLCRVSEGSIV